jgi:predicted ribosome quality control (RQC) complex YloA/Tae2 family protein
VDDVRADLLKSIAREGARLRRRVKAIEGDLAAGETAQREAEAVRPFVAEAARRPRGTASMVAVDWSTGEPVERTLALDPARRPIDQLEAIFARARRLKRGARIARGRLEEAQAKQARLTQLREALTGATTRDEVRAACDAAHRQDPSILPGLAARTSLAKGQPRKAATPGRQPYRAFVSTTGGRILVGRGAADNDALTIHVARPRDLWLHARTTGAHVIVPMGAAQAIPPDLLIDAAHLAAHFSDARGEPVVDVTYVPRRYVRKRRGSPPGQVQVEREKVLVLRIEPERLAALLAREERES